MKITFIAAMSENRVIGIEGKLPWHLPNDLKHFKNLTLGKDILMGRKTFLSLKRPLPNRRNYVLTTDTAFTNPHIYVFHSKQEVLHSGLDEVLVIGGEEVFKLFMPECEKIYLTIVHESLQGDAYFPEFTGFLEKSRRFFPRDAQHEYNYSFLEYIKSDHPV